LAPSAGLSFQETPTFNFTPLSGDAVTKALFAPLPNNVFNFIFSNWHADVAIRTAVSSMQLVPPTLSATSDPAVLRITPEAVVKMPPRKPPSTEKKKPALTLAIRPAVTPTKVGETATFTVSVSESYPVTYQWQLSKDAGWTWEDVSDGLAVSDRKDPDFGAAYSGSDEATLTVAGVALGMERFEFRCKVKVKPEAEMLWPQLWTNDSSAPKSDKYALFLALAYELWKAQSENIIPPPYESDAQKEIDEKAKKEAKEDAVTIYNIKLADAISAKGSGYSIEDASKAEKETKDHAYTIYKKPRSPSEDFTVQLPDAKLLTRYPLLEWIVSNGWQLTWNLRSFDNMLYSVAKEDEKFRKLVPASYGSDVKAKAKVDADRKAMRAAVMSDLSPLDLGQKQGDTDSKIPDVSFQACPESNMDKDGACVEILVSVNNVVREVFLARPILRLTHYHPTYTLSELWHVYQDQGKLDYKVGDTAGENEPFLNANPAERPGVTPSIENQTEFTLLSYIFNQASIDSSKLPVQQLIQVH
jgi:hypothetical protein